MALDHDIRLFAAIELFRLMEPEAVRLLAFSAETKLLRAGDILVRAPGPLDGGQLLTKGSLAIFADANQIEAPKRIVRAPALVGELALITETSFEGSVLAREPSSVLRISREMFHRVLMEYPISARAIQAALAKRLQNLSDELAPLSAV